METKYYTYPNSVKIETDFLDLPNIGIIERPVSVEGIVAPISTKGRKQAPNPLAFTNFQTKNNSIKMKDVVSNCDRGHIFALSLGGPDVSANIIPQWSKFQEVGDWRRLEVKIAKIAKSLFENNVSLYLEIKIEYLNLDSKSDQELLRKIFLRDMRKVQPTKEEIIKYLQVFGTPLSYQVLWCPCSVNLKNPLSLPHVKYLYNMSRIIHSYKESYKTQNLEKLALLLLHDKCIQELSDTKQAKRFWDNPTLIIEELEEKVQAFYPVTNKKALPNYISDKDESHMETMHFSLLTPEDLVKIALQ